MFDKNNLFGKLNTMAKGLDIAMNKVTSTVSNKINGNTESTATEQNDYVEFIPAMGMGAKFYFTENGLVHGGTEYPYEQLQALTMVSPPMPMTNAVAEIATLSGKSLTLGYPYNQREQFIEILTNNIHKIDRRAQYKYILFGINGSKIEVYDDYILLYYLQGGVSKTIKNISSSGATGQVIPFDQVTLQITEPTEDNHGVLKIIVDGTVTELDLIEITRDIACNIISYIQTEKNTEKPQEPEWVAADWEPIVGQSRTFTLMGQTLEISARQDIYNSYRKQFHEMATGCTHNARLEFNKKVHDLNTYLQFFPTIYVKHRDVLVKTCMEILISENIWTVTEDSFLSDHNKDFHKVMDTVKVTTDSIEMTSQQNQQRVSGVMSLVPNLVGGGFGFKGAAKGIAAATAFNLVRDGIESGLTNVAANLNQPQQLELYNRINHDILFDEVFSDYWMMYRTLIWTMCDNGKNIWRPTTASQQADSIFKNLSNPRFPQEKIPETILSIIQTNPYRVDYHRYLIEHFGNTPEVQAITSYFGY